MSVSNQEIQIGKLAAKKLQQSIRQVIAVETVRTTGSLMRSSVKAVSDKHLKDKLDRLTISSPHYGFKLNYGFKGIKSNRVAMNLAPINHLHLAIERTNILNQLADDIGNLRADEVIAAINF